MNLEQEHHCNSRKGQIGLDLERHLLRDGRGVDAEAGQVRQAQDVIGEGLLQEKEVMDVNRESFLSLN